jgi:hypothetical protein
VHGFLRRVQELLSTGKIIDVDKFMAEIRDSMTLANHEVGSRVSSAAADAPRVLKMPGALQTKRYVAARQFI